MRSEEKNAVLIGTAKGKVRGNSVGGAEATILANAFLQRQFMPFFLRRLT